MAIKWKNIKPMSFLKRTWKFMVVVLITLFVGSVILLNVLNTPYGTETIWRYGIFMNISYGIAVTCILREVIRNLYGSWLPDYGDFYEDWKKIWKKWQRTIGVTVGILLVFATWYFSMMMTAAAWFVHYSYVSNYASGYLLYATIGIQAFLVELVFVRFMLGRLQMLMEHMQEVNQLRLEEALEIERQSMEKVSRSDQLRVDLITNVSHDLKTPLTSMVGYIELMKKEELTDTAKDYLEVISNRAGKLKEMIESLFNLAKASSGNVELHKEKLQLNRLLEQLMADMEDKISASDMEYIMMLTKEDTTLETDNAYLYRICQNLIENTLKYSAKGTRVFIKTQRTKTQLCIEITNTSGYPMDFTKEDIVERFARADKARSTEGNGLGLAIVSTYAAALGGEFDILLDCDQFKARLSFPLSE